MSRFGYAVGPASVARIVRTYEDALRDVTDRTTLVPPVDGAAVVGKTVDGGSYPAAAQAVYMLALQDINVEPTEGATASFTDSDPGAMVPALNLGGGSPPKGTYVIAHALEGNWLFHY
jgi:hypothetical protein